MYIWFVVTPGLPGRVCTLENCLSKTTVSGIMYPVHIIEHTLNMLEKNNMIKVSVDKKTGEKEILPLDKYEKVW